VIHLKFLNPIHSVLVFTGLFILSGCGDIGGAGQCAGVEASGACTTLDSIDPVDGSGNLSPNVDAFIIDDCDGDPDTVDPETGLFDHRAEVTISYNLQSGVTAPPAPDFFTVRTYVIDYIPNPSNNPTFGLAPPLSSWEFPADNKRILSNTTVTLQFELFPVITKFEYQNAGGSENPMFYTVLFTFLGKNEFNDDVVLQGSTNISVANWDLCGS